MKVGGEWNFDEDEENVGYWGRRYVNPRLRPSGRPNFGDRARGIASAGLYHSRNFLFSTRAVCSSRSTRRQGSSNHEVPHRRV